MTNTPQNVPVLGGVTPYLMIDGAVKAAAFYEKAFAAEVAFMYPADAQGRTMHVHLHINGASVMLSDFYPEHGVPKMPPQAFNLMLRVDDVEAWWKRAVDAGGEIAMPLNDMFWGDRYGQVRDPFGVTWALSQPIRELSAKLQSCPIADGASPTEELRLATPEVVDIAATSAAVEWGKLQFADIPSFQRSARARIDSALADQGVETKGPEVTFSRPPEGGTIDIAPGVIVEHGFAPSGPVTIQEIPAGRAARARLEGPYEQLPKAWGAFMSWVAAEGLQPAGLHWEVYRDRSVPVTELYTLLK